MRPLHVIFYSIYAFFILRIMFFGHVKLDIFNRDFFLQPVVHYSNCFQFFAVFEHGNYGSQRDNRSRQKILP